MAPKKATISLIFILSLTNGDKMFSCDHKYLAKRLGYSADAWKLIEHKQTRYLLMFHSYGSLGSTYNCLCTVRSNPDHHDPWKRTLKYHTTPNSTLMLSKIQKVWSHKTSHYFVYYNEVDTLYYVNVAEYPDFHYDERISRNEVVYANQQKCLLLKSEELGYHVWVEYDHYNATKKIPYECVFFYEACAGTTKKWVSNEAACPSYDHCKREENKQPKT